MDSCRLCGATSFSQYSQFAGTTFRYQNLMYLYARCDSCDSIVRLSGEPVDYTEYITSERIARPEVNRFAKFLSQIRVEKTESVLDYGCGNGALVSELQKRGYANVSGYEPFNPELCDTVRGRKFSVVYLLHVFEHLTDWERFFSDLDEITKTDSTIAMTAPSSSRIPKLDPTCPFQRYTVHAPFHTVVPSDDILVDTFTEKGYSLQYRLPFDIQRSGIWQNNRVSALLQHNLGGTKERLLTAGLLHKVRCLIKSPVRFFEAMFLNTRDHFASTLVFQRSEGGLKKDAPPFRSARANGA